MWRVVYTKQALKNAKKISAAGLRSKAESLLDILGENPYQTGLSYELGSEVPSVSAATDA